MAGMEARGNTVWLVVPCYNEEDILSQTKERLEKKLAEFISKGLASAESRILFVDDGSSDSTWKLIEEFHRESELCCGLSLSRNRGHQNALLAGMMEAKENADCIISLDADLQDDIEVMEEFIEKYLDGCDIVYGVRANREKDSFFKRTTAQGFYKMMRWLGVEIVYNHADYRLMSRRALEGLAEFKETNLFLRGIVPMIGYRSDYVFYERQERTAGKSKYSLGKMLSLAVSGVTSLSVRPLKMIAALGVTVSLLSVFALLYALLSKLLGYAVAGWTAIVASIWLIGGIQLFSIGVLGTYIGRIYNEVKARPRYIIKETLKK